MIAASRRRLTQAGDHAGLRRLLSAALDGGILLMLLGWCCLLLAPFTGALRGPLILMAAGALIALACGRFLWRSAPTWPPLAVSPMPVVRPAASDGDDAAGRRSGPAAAARPAP